MTDLGDFDTFGQSGQAEEVAAGDGPESPGETAGFEPMDVKSTGTDRGIGVLSAADGLAIGEGDETRLRAYITVGNRSAVRLGTYLLIPYPDDETLFCRIAGLEYVQEFHADDATEIHARRVMRSAGIDEQDYKFMATLEPVAVLYADGDDRQRRMTDRVPKPETVVRRARDKAEIKTGLKIPSEGIFLGHLSVGGERVRTAADPPTIDYRLKDGADGGDPLVFRHTLVAGGTGSGKTHAAKNVLRQYLVEDRRYEMPDGARRRPAIVQFDPQDEYAQMHDDNPAVTDESAREWEREGIAHGGHDDTVAFVPRVGEATYAASHHRAEQVAFTVPFSMVQDNPWLVAAGGLNDNQYGALLDLLGRFFAERGEEEATYRGFRRYLDDPSLRADLDDRGRIHEATFDAVSRRVRAVPGGVFDQDARPITELVREFVRPGRLSVVPTYHLNDSRAAVTVVLALASLLIDEKLSNDPTYTRIKETPLIVGMDEAHTFLAGAESVQAGRVIGKFTEAAKQGRKERLGLFLVTQDPQDIADAVFKQINTTVVLNLGDEAAISAVNVPATLEGKVPYMATGEMVVYAPDNSEPVELVGLDACVTRHGRE